MIYPGSCRSPASRTGGPEKLFLLNAHVTFGYFAAFVPGEPEAQDGSVQREQTSRSRPGGTRLAIQKRAVWRRCEAGAPEVGSARQRQHSR